MDKKLSITASIATIIGFALGLGGGVTYTNVIKTQESVQIIFQQKIRDLPPEKREFAENIMNDVLQAAGGSESEIKAAANDFRNRILETQLLSYDVVKSPFPLTRQRTVLLCDEKFSVAYQLDNASGSQRFLINGKIHAGKPGDVFNPKEGGKQLQLRYMEYLKTEETAIMSFNCS